jgi:hypothetical protein
MDSRERTQGPKKYKIEHALGGKNVYYFLTPFPRGRLQTLPIAYDINKKEWFDTAASGVRHFPGTEREQPVTWLDPAYTFNISCYSCHVSQLTTNYDLKTDTYETTWREPGINCETCHGPSEEHNRVCREAPKGTVLADLKIISAKKFTADQHNATCSVCHAKMIPLTATFTPGEKFSATTSAQTNKASLKTSFAPEWFISKLTHTYIIKTSTISTSIETRLPILEWRKFPLAFQDASKTLHELPQLHGQLVL